MKMSHKGMGITKADYEAFMHCLADTLNTFEVPEPERGEVVAFITGLEPKSWRESCSMETHRCAM
jgi:hemoglobin